MTHNNCLSDDTLTNYLEGVLEVPLRNAAEEHMAECDDCRGKLGHYMRILDEQVLPAEEEIVEEAMARFEARQSLRPLPAEAMAHASGRRRSRVAAALVMVAAVTIVAAIGLVGWNPAPSAGDVLQSLYAERPYQARFSDQVSHAPYTETRAVGDETDRALPAAMEAFLEDSSELQLGTYLLAIGDFDRGMPIMRRVVDQTGDARAHNDLGVAYLEMGGAGAVAANFEAARREFEAAIEADPDLLAPVFNMAFLLARTGMNEEALRYVSEYVALDPNSPWADELQSLAEGLGR